MARVTYGLSNVHYSVITETEGVITYATPVPHPGSVSLTVTPKGESSDFFADNQVYFSSSSNQGYDGTLELAMLTEAFRKDVLGEIEVTEDGVLIEVADAKPKKIALSFQFEDDEKGTRHTLFYCYVSRTGMGSSTTTTTQEPGTVELTFVSAPRPDNKRVKVSTGSTTPEAIYDAWFEAVYE